MTVGKQLSSLGFCSGFACALFCAVVLLAAGLRAAALRAAAAGALGAAFLAAAFGLAACARLGFCMRLDMCFRTVRHVVHGVRGNVLKLIGQRAPPMRWVYATRCSSWFCVTTWRLWLGCRLWPLLRVLPHVPLRLPPLARPAQGLACVNEYFGCAGAAAACGLALSDSAKSLKLMFMPFKVLSVMRCTSKRLNGGAHGFGVLL